MSDANEAVTISPRKPTVVVIVSILQLLSSAMFFLASLIFAVVAIFGTSWGFDKQLGEVMATYGANPNLSFGVAVLFGGMSAGTLISGILLLIQGIGLLKGSKVSWYVQVALSIVGLLGFPIFTAVNGVILFFFFKRDIRDFYRT